MQTQDRNDATKIGFTPQAENWNGRFATIGFFIAMMIELTTGQGVLHFWGLM
ncbi:chlorophyll A-B binding protein [Coleofasciculus sp. FACHB-64]|uniref:chlorophyll A-B binding protein n=1 Tax=Cyanophyceae TaxID=3028117 RepID=UPI0016862F87|nr:MULTISPECIES: chlorophyll A-B binding protein [unclassified Coleofasciculus]MBD1840169.1 chlorophyll A-B binding protein [Coleofasciculus sp. FACHB-501]MBD1887733.1 chlorophyll A-B binding protein [Coleofasciculus sp. FACHB-SPT9]MBD2046448.1 chlorophyll A-B binding protein [Coleofasciculus sp. FACHB-64]